LQNHDASDVAGSIANDLWVLNIGRNVVRTDREQSRPPIVETRLLLH